MPILTAPSSAVSVETRHADSDPADVKDLLLLANADKDTRSRVGGFIAWLIETQRAWYNPDLAAYRDHLIVKGYRSATISAHLSSVRAAYQRLLRNNTLRAAWFDSAGAELRALQAADTPANRKAFVDERHTRLQNAIVNYRVR